MSLEDRFRHTLTAAVDHVRATLEAEFQSVIATVKDDASQAQEHAVTEARTALEATLTHAFEEEKAALSQQLRTDADAAVAAVLEEKQQAVTEAATLREEASRLREEAATLRGDAAALREEGDRLRQEADRLREEGDRLRGDAERAGEAARLADQTHGGAAQAHEASASRVLDSVRALDHATSLSDVLDTLTSASAHESGRAAILVVKGPRLIGWRTSGFGAFDGHPRTIESSTDDSGVLARAVASGKAVVAGKGAATAAPSFSGLTLDQTGLAVPLLVGGRAVAVVYADAGASVAPSPSWQAAVEVLVRHAGRCLEALTVQRAAQARSSSVRVGSPA